jgi:hypothetical protein
MSPTLHTTNFAKTRPFRMTWSSSLVQRPAMRAVAPVNHACDRLRVGRERKSSAVPRPEIGKAGVKRVNEEDQEIHRILFG